VWAYSQYLQFTDFKFPNDIQVDPQFFRLKPPQQWISEWHLGILAKEVLLNGQNFPDGRHTLRSWKILASVLNKMKTFEDEIPLPPPDPTHPLIMLNRIAHQQFVWQTERPGSRAYIRNYKIYNTAGINEICLERIGLPVFDLYLCGMAFMGSYMHAPASAYPMKLDIRTLSIEKIDRFLKFSGRGVTELKRILKSEQRYDDSFFYA
jgi:hypothetical protein